MAGFGPMGALSPEEEEAMLRAAAAKQGMISQSALSPEVLALANKEYGGQQRAIDTQKAMAAKMLGAKGKQGHMMGNVYAGPTWSDSLANVAEKLTGGYQMKKAREADTDLETSMAGTASAKGEVEEHRLQQALKEQKDAARLLADAKLKQSGAEIAGRADVAALKETGGFTGTGMDAQAIRIWTNPQIPADDPQKILAGQHLSKPQTTTTPQGTTTRPGFDLSALTQAEGSGSGGGGEAGANETFDPKLDTETEMRAGYTTASMGRLDQELGDYVPSFQDTALSALTPKQLVAYTTTDDYQIHQAAGDEWARNLVFLRSGATARQEEVDGAIDNYVTKPGESDKVIASKKRRRKAAVKDASQMYLKRQNNLRKEQGLPPIGSLDDFGEGDTMNEEMPSWMRDQKISADADATYRAELAAEEEAAETVVAPAPPGKTMTDSSGKTYVMDEDGKWVPA